MKGFLLIACLLTAAYVWGQSDSTLNADSISFILKPKKLPVPCDSDTLCYRTHTASGTASWYGQTFQGRYTSSGERFDMNKMTAAHKNLPLGTYVVVTNLSNGRSVVVKINDRMPLHNSREIDLSMAAAKQLDFLRAGLAKVQVEILKYPD
jgi:rare lipoprotein A (peptidoglycan hydrolase)